MGRSLVFEKSLAFAVRIVNLYKYLNEQKREPVMSKQLLRSGTSIGANISESLNAESDSDFVHKLSIAQREVNETSYWIQLLEKTEYLTSQEYESMSNDIDELRKMIASIILTKKENIHRNKRKSQLDGTNETHNS